MNAMVIQGFADARERAREVGITSPEMAGVDGTKLAILVVVIAAIVAAVLVARYMKKHGLSVATVVSTMRSNLDARTPQQLYAAKHCAGCGAPIAQGTKFCPKCGQRLS